MIDLLRTYLLILVTCLLIPKSAAQPEEIIGFITPISTTFDLEYKDFYDIAEDWNGFVWMTTRDGLYRMDGTKSKRYGPSSHDSVFLHHTFFDMLIDRNEKEIWLATAYGVCRFDPEQEQSKYYVWDYNDPNSLADNIARSIHMDPKGRIWINCRARGLSQYRKASDDFVHYHFDLPDIEVLQEKDPSINESLLNSYNLIVSDDENEDLLWLGSPLGLVSFDIAEERYRWHFKNHPDITNVYPENSIHVIIPQKEDVLMGTLDQALLYNLKTERIQTIRPPGESPLENVREIFPQANATYWISYQNGLGIYDAKTQEFVDSWVDDPEQEKHYGVRFIDREKRRWIHSSGVTQLYDPLKQIVKQYSIPQIERAKLQVAKRIDEQTIAVLTDHQPAIHWFDLKTLSWSKTPIQTSINWQQKDWKDILLIADKKMLLLSEDEVFELDLNSRQLRTFELPVNIQDAVIRTGLIDSQNNFWMGSIRQGLYQNDLTTGQTRHFVEEFNAGYSQSLYTWITHLLEDQKGNIWVRMARSYAVYEPDTKELFLFPYYKNADRTFRYISDIEETDNGDIWIASTDSGIGKVKDGNYKEGISLILTEKEGLLSNRVLDLAVDKEKQWLWIHSNRGISTYDFNTGTVQNYTWDRGLPKPRKMIAIGNGQLALALPQGGISIFDPVQIQQKKVVPRPYITAIRTKNKVAYESGNRTSLEAFEVDDGRDYLQFEFSALGYSNPKEFSYRLVPVDEEWVTIRELRSSAYANLSPGNYTFLLRSRLEGSVWSEPQEVAIRLLPRIWETQWFKFCSLLLLLFIAYALYRWRLENVKQQERLKADFQHKLDEVEMQALRTQMNPHFLFNSLNSVQLYIIQNKPKLAVGYLDRFSRLMRLILRNSREQTVPLKDELEALHLYIELEKLRFKTPFDHQIVVASEMNQYEIEVPPMILQPFVENAIWHGIQHKKTKGNIEIDIRPEGEQMICSITDNGIGRTAAQELKKGKIKKHQSMGMKITKDRLDIINQSNGQPNVVNASMELIDLYDDEQKAMGTKVILRLPLDLI